MRLAEVLAALIVAASLAASAAAQNGPSQDQGEALAEGLTACASMFSQRHPSATLPPHPPSSDPFTDNGYGKERAIAYGLRPLAIEDLRKAGWELERKMPGRSRSVELARRASWGRATLRQADLTCSFAMFAIRDGQLEADLLLATATSWVASTYPGAAVVGEVETLDERLNGPVLGKPSALTRTQWKSPDGMRVSLSITRPRGERGGIIVSALMNYLPTRPPQASPTTTPT